MFMRCYSATATTATAHHDMAADIMTRSGEKHDTRWWFRRQMSTL
jgi:hypothetical protein